MPSGQAKAHAIIETKMRAAIIVRGAEAILRIEFEPSLNELTVKEAVFWAETSVPRGTLSREVAAAASSLSEKPKLPGR
jgi:hypothetical protein